MRRMAAAALLLMPLPAVAGSSLTGGSIAQPTSVTAAAILAAGGATNTSVQQMINNTAIPKTGGNAGATIATPALPGATDTSSLATQLARMPNVAAYTPAGGTFGGGTITSDLASQASGDKSVTIPATSAAVVGRLMTSTSLPVGTTITSVGTASTQTVSHALSNPTTNTYPVAITTPATILERGFYQLQFSDVFNLPGTFTDSVRDIQSGVTPATVTGTGIPAGTYVVAVQTSSTGTIVYISAQPTQALAAGASISFGYSQQVIGLSNGLTGPTIPGAGLGIATQDDTGVFNSAMLNTAPINGGKGGGLYIPSGNYYMASGAGGRQGISLITGNQVNFLPGSYGPGALQPGFSNNTGMGIFYSAQDPIESGLEIYHDVGQSRTGVQQGQALRIDLANSGIYDGGNKTTPGNSNIGIEIAGSSVVDFGLDWAYHTVLFGGGYGHRTSLVGGEWEFEPNTHWDINVADTQGAVLGWHPDCLGDTACGIVMEPGGNGWHDGLVGVPGAITDWIVGLNNVGGSTSNDYAAGLRVDGGLVGTSLQTAASAAGQVGGTINATGDAGLNSVTTGTITSASGGVSSVAVAVGGRWDLIPSVRFQPPVTGTPATGHVSLAALDYINTGLPIVAGAASNVVPSGVISGTVCTLTGGTLANGGTAATTTWNGSYWAVSNPGSYTVPPTGTLAAPLASTCSGVSSPPSFWPLWTTKAVAVDTPGSGYNPASPPRTELYYPSKVVNDATYGSGYFGTWPRLTATVPPTPAPLVLNNSGLTENGSATVTGSFSAQGGTPASGSGNTADTLAPNQCGSVFFPASGADTITVPSTLPSGCQIDIVSLNGQSNSIVAGSGMNNPYTAYGSAVLLPNGTAHVRVMTSGNFSVEGDVFGVAPLASPAFTGTGSIPAWIVGGGVAQNGYALTTNGASYTNGNEYVAFGLTAGAITDNGALAVTGAATLSAGGTSTTPTAGDSSTKIATTAFVSTATSTLAPKASPTFTGYVAFSVGPGLSAAGTTLATATALTKQDNFVTTVASGSGVALPNAPVGAHITVGNRGANTLNIYPFSSSDQIEATTAGTAATLAANTTAVFERDIALHWYRVQ